MNISMIDYVCAIISGFELSLSLLKNIGAVSSPTLEITYVRKFVLFCLIIKKNIIRLRRSFISEGQIVSVSQMSYVTFTTHVQVLISFFFSKFSALKPGRRVLTHFVTSF